MCTYSFLQTIIFAVAAIAAWVAVFVAIVAIVKSRKTEKEKATLKFMRIYSSDEELDHASQILKTKPSYPLEGEDRAKVHRLLNTFESLAIGIDHDIYDTEMIEKGLGEGILITYNLAENYIKGCRQKQAEFGSAHAWEEFEELSKKIQLHRPIITKPSKKEHGSRKQHS